MESEWSDEEFYATTIEFRTAENGDGDITRSRANSTSDPLLPESAEYDAVVSGVHVETADKPSECCTRLSFTEDSADKNETVSSTGSDDDKPLSVIQSQMRMKKKKDSINDHPVSSDYDDSDRDADYIPSSESMSDASDTPPIAFDRRKRKWVRKRNRPLKREEGRKHFSFTEKIPLCKKATWIRSKKPKTNMK